ADRQAHHPNVAAPQPFHRLGMARDADRALFLGGLAGRRGAGAGASTAWTGGVIDTRGRHALIVGYGRSGRAAAAFIAQRGGSVRVVDRADTPELRADLERAGIPARLGGYGAEALNGP